MFYVYQLQSFEHPTQRYTGYTEDVQARLVAHNNGQSPNTAKHKPWQLVNYFAFSDENTARDFEDYLKSGSGRAFANKRLWPPLDKSSPFNTKDKPTPLAPEEESKDTAPFLKPASVSPSTLDWITMWMDSSNDLERAFLDAETGEIYIGTDEVKNACGKTVAPDEDDRFIYLQPVDSSDGYMIRKDFAQSADISEPTRERFLRALNGPKPFRRFMDVILSDDRASRAFEDFKTEEIIKILAQSLENQGYKLQTLHRD
ncbi:GIY-YIG nuclease family protein [Pelagicoccus mobilis]|uniref:GIY-YIG nuclease family protein n=1 Tax=Pelagicoccus mobilis TaxID=415221 RepID=A0A934RYX6_9BACT|nr:GIY-YIG nuclease family protein [Pelagicoccus mobilis]MBK1876882.1 GIY-YIG nuclease family protein [Pelagicoccus mobilis]